MEVEFGLSMLADPQTCRCLVTHYDRNANWTDLARFGATVIPMFQGKSVFPDGAERAEGKMVRHMLDVLRRKEFNPAKDYIVLAGDILIQAVAVAVVSKHLGSFTALRFDKREGRYWPFRVQL